MKKNDFPEFFCLKIIIIPFTVGNVEEPSFPVIVVVWLIAG
ncbi:MAG: hypothetical protein NTV61_10420 [Candidatus Bathyarchaeota archaeon]|nr:hypothetical protein [Candidatus Bathyarchaeota archaeon]